MLFLEDHDRSQLRALVSSIERKLAAYDKQEDGVSLEEIRASWLALVGILTLGSGPEVQEPGV